MRKVMSLFGLSVLLVSLTACPLTDATGRLEVRRAFEDHNAYGVVFVCEGDKLTVRWDIDGASFGTLSAWPPGATLPRLASQRVEASGELELQILRAVDLTLDVAGDRDERSAALAPGDLCTGFPAPLLGNFTGTLEQSLPVPQTLSRRLVLKWREGVQGPQLQGTLRLADGDEYSDYLLLDCAADARTQSLSCSDSAAAPSFNLSATVTEQGLTGSYQGVQKEESSSAPFSGTLRFTRTP